MPDGSDNPLELLCQRIALEDDVAGVVIAETSGRILAFAGDPDAVDMELVDQDPDELDLFEKDGLGCTALPLDGVGFGVRVQHLVEGKLRLGIGFELDADRDTIKALGQQAGLEAMRLIRQLAKS